MNEENETIKKLRLENERLEKELRSADAQVGILDRALAILVLAGHVKQEKVDIATELAAQ